MSVNRPVNAQPLQTESKVVIRKGDTLSSLFDQHKFGQATLLYLMSADESLLALETLKPGHTLFFRYAPDTQYLEEMELYIHAGLRGYIVPFLPGIECQVHNEKTEYDRVSVFRVLKATHPRSLNTAGLPAQICVDQRVSSVYRLCE